MQVLGRVCGRVSTAVCVASWTFQNNLQQGAKGIQKGSKTRPGGCLRRAWEGLWDTADEGSKKETPKSGLGEFVWRGLFGVLFALGRRQAPKSVNLKHLLGGFVFGSNFGAILNQIEEVCGSKNIVFALKGLQKSHFHLSWILDHFGLHLGVILEPLGTQNWRLTLQGPPGEPKRGV